MQKVSLGSILALFLFAACGSTTDDAFAITYDSCNTLVIAAGADSSDAERASIESGIALWNTLGVVQLTTDLAKPGDVIQVSFKDAAPNFFGLYDDNVGEVFINRGLSDERKRTITVAHELGHAFGLHHVDDRTSVMNKANLTVVPNDEDARAVQALQSCAPNEGY